MNWYQAAFSMIGGVGLLLYGMSLMKDNLQKVAGKKLREILIILTKNRLVGLGLGMLFTLLFQSSTATTVLLIGLTSASIITLRETLAVLLGSDIGSTITAQLIALKATEISLPVIFIATFALLFSKTHRKKRLSLAIMGFGLLFLGLKIMSDTMAPLKSNPSVGLILTKLSAYPALEMAVAAIFTFLVSSSAATIGIIMLLTMQQMITLEQAIFMLLGANIGTTFTPLLSSIGSSRESQRVAWAHFLFKTTGVLLFLPFVNQVASLMKTLAASPGFQVANTHTFFNVTIAFLYLPFIHYFATFLEKWIKDKKADNVFSPKYLDEHLLNSPELAIGMSLKETIQISDLVTEMVRPIYSLFDYYNQDKVDRILEREDKVDLLSLATNNYLTQLLRHPLTRDEFNRSMALVNIVREYEFIGDVIERNILGKAENMNIRNLDFSPSGQQEIKLIHDKTMEILLMVNTSFATNNAALGAKALNLQEELTDLHFRLKMSHIARMRSGGTESEKTSFIHIDLLNCYLQISEHLKNIVLLSAPLSHHPEGSEFPGNREIPQIIETQKLPL
ncbi:Na/Pi cotransporter family protein [Desulforamulus aeronauticus]|uniref:Phosphate:Na+ symporter n=1 Tax=Desulforamulus aeronauticus DSM 10349 TaxID=1121421 RepID=A0A1M6UQR7_9FIRM|nr:phosphate:Na+ symporter [Desulforamulus aeronauticus DSM 10349]